MELPFNLETPLERRIASDPDFGEGVWWGVPRDGHPEGAVAYHVRDLLANIDYRGIDFVMREQLRIIALTHDSFKYQVDNSKPRVPPNEHAFLARVFTQRFVSDEGVLNVVEFHDEAYRSWRVGQRRNDPLLAEHLARELLRKLNDVPLFLQFYDCDNDVSGKERTHYEWFKGLADQQA